MLSWGSAYLSNVGQGFNSLYTSEQNRLSENFRVEYIYINSSKTLTTWVGNYGTQEIVLDGVVVSNSTYSQYIPLSSRISLPPDGLVHFSFNFNVEKILNTR